MMGVGLHLHTLWKVWPYWLYVSIGCLVELVFLFLLQPMCLTRSVTCWRLECHTRVGFCFLFLFLFFLGGGWGGRGRMMGGVGVNKETSLYKLQGMSLHPRYIVHVSCFMFQNLILVSLVAVNMFNSKLMIISISYESLPLNYILITSIYTTENPS